MVGEALHHHLPGMGTVYLAQLLLKIRSAYVFDVKCKYQKWGARWLSSVNENCIFQLHHSGLRIFPQFRVLEDLFENVSFLFIAGKTAGRDQ